MILDLFAGPGGWDLAARELGLDVLGLEWDDAVCRTREAAGLNTACQDVARCDPGDYGPAEGLIASPPCQAWSMAGKRGGERDKPLVYRALADLEAGRDTRNQLRAQCEDERSLLVVEPLRGALALQPTWIALEQVPPVLELWQEYRRILIMCGWRVWTGILSAERYGVPQTRKRAILMAHRDCYPAPPQATHQAHVPGEPARQEHTFEGVLLPWVSMAEALGWGGAADDRPARTVCGHRTVRWAYGEGDSYATGWTLDGRGQPDGRTGRPARPRTVDEPVPTVLFRNNGAKVAWVHDRPATTVAGDSRVHPPGHKRNAHDEAAGRDHYEGRAGENAVRLTEHEATVLQGFPADYPFQGGRTKRFEQIGNAIPPPLAGAILAELVGVSGTKAA